MKPGRSAIAAAALGCLVCCGSGAKQAAEPAPGGQAGECKVLEDCAPGLVCQAGMCLPYEGAAGDPCYDELDCELGLDCRAGTCVEEAPDQ
jgi:hypothetical protein